MKISESYWIIFFSLVFLLVPHSRKLFMLLAMYKAKLFVLNKKILSAKHKLFIF